MTVSETVIFDYFANTNELIMNEYYINISHLADLLNPRVSTLLNTVTPAQLDRQLFDLEMGVVFKHLQSLATRHGYNFKCGQITPLYEPRQGFVSENVKSKILNFRASNGSHKGMINGHAFHGGYLASHFCFRHISSKNMLQRDLFVRINRLSNLSLWRIKMTARRTKEERIAALEAQIQKLKQESSAPKEVKLTKESYGITTAIAAIENAAKLNSVSVGDIIKAISRFKRTGLKIENSVRKSKE
ncbi:MAG: hypothetical protein Q7U78_05390 [Gallionella sp.]|nr:hypothetical protein [Gallionella sp.]